MFVKTTALKKQQKRRYSNGSVHYCSQLYIAIIVTYVTSVSTYTEANTNSWVIIILFQKMTEVKKTWQKCKG